MQLIQRQRTFGQRFQNIVTPWALRKDKFMELAKTKRDPAANEIVLRSTSNFGRAIVVPAENSAWLKTPEDRAAPQIAAQQNVRQRIVRSDEELAEFEEQRTREAQLAREAAAGRIHFRTETSPAAASPRTMTNDPAE